MAVYGSCPRGDFELATFRSTSKALNHYTLHTTQQWWLKLLDLSPHKFLIICYHIQSFLPQEYRQICLNINRIKIAMELGQTVVLCNLENLYESLYDALNQVS